MKTIEFSYYFICGDLCYIATEHIGIDDDYLDPVPSSNFSKIKVKMLST